MRHYRCIEIFFYPLGDSKRHLRNVKACPRTQPRARFHYINYYVSNINTTSCAVMTRMNIDNG